MSKCDICRKALRIKDTCLGSHPGWVHKTCCKTDHSKDKK